MCKLSMRPNEERGILVTFCGLDGCGKTTMIQRLIHELADYDVFLTKQPTPFVRTSEIFSVLIWIPPTTMHMITAVFPCLPHPTVYSIPIA